MKIEMRKTDDLIPYVNNARTHSEQQVTQIAASIKEFGFNNPILLGVDNDVIAGHGRLLAAKKLKLKEVPTIELGHLSEAQKKAYILADNKLALNAGWDEELLKAELEGLVEIGFDIAVTGFDASDFLDDSSIDEEYTHKIQSPLYEITGEKPPISALCDSSKADELVEEIKKTKGVSDEEKAFLIKAAYRHLVFSYADIAEFYAHSSEKVQKLMEKSALVIIDFDDAIANGFVSLTQEIDEIMGLSGE